MICLKVMLIGSPNQGSFQIAYNKIAMLQKVGQSIDFKLLFQQV